MRAIVREDVASREVKEGDVIKIERINEGWQCIDFYIVCKYPVGNFGMPNRYEYLLINVNGIEKIRGNNMDNLIEIAQSMSSKEIVHYSKEFYDILLERNNC